MNDQIPQGPNLAATPTQSPHETLLRELYAQCLGGAGQAMPPAMTLALQASFGGVEQWRDEFLALGSRPGSDHTWLVLAWQPREGKLVNQALPDIASAAATGSAILALDLWAHRRQRVPGTAAVESIDALVRDIHWSEVHRHYQRAVAATSEPLGASLTELQGSRLVDVRREAVYAQADSVLPGAIWRDPAVVGDWAASLFKHEPVVVYCLHGHEVSQATALRLHALGLNVRFLRGGIEGWKLAGLATQPKSSR